MLSYSLESKHRVPRSSGPRFRSFTLSLSTHDQRERFHKFTTGVWLNRSDYGPSSGYDVSSSWNLPDSFACIRPDADIVVPMFTPYALRDIVKPSANLRHISALLRFSVNNRDGKYLVSNHGHRLRHELLAFWNESVLEGSVVGEASEEATNEDMKHATFCLSPPGNTQVSFCPPYTHSCPK